MSKYIIAGLFASFTFSILFLQMPFAGEMEVSYYDLQETTNTQVEQIYIACDLLGIKIRTHFVNLNEKKRSYEQVPLCGDNVSIISGRLFQNLGQDLQKKLGPSHSSHSRHKILIFGFTPITNSESLKEWSEGSIIGAQHLQEEGEPVSIKISKREGISLELGDTEYPLVVDKATSIAGFQLEDDSGKAVPLIELRDNNGENLVPLFVKCDTISGDIFFLSSSWKDLHGKPDKGRPTEINRFTEIAPILMFLKYSFGERCWHGSNDYANLTIDDPWLRKPYGHVNYADLCKEAKEAPFHATVGFIPYNYDRSQEEAVALFQNCRDNLSLAIHGNNHDFLEFEREGNQSEDRRRILQALQRMDALQRKTGLSYDRVMVFPRGIFTQTSLGLLKENNFLMTVNATAGPVDTPAVQNAVDNLRGVTMRFSSFPMVKRAMVQEWRGNRLAESVARQWIAMRLFLDLPVLFATHHDFFKGGMDRFNPIAEAVNRMQPAVKWASLGEIGRALYLQRRIADREMEVLAFSSDLIVKNPYPFEMQYTVCKEDDFALPIEAVQVDGTKHDYRLAEGRICVQTPIAPVSEKSINIRYGSDAQTTAVDASSNELQATVVRALSDFRDIHLSRNACAEEVVSLFYRLGGVRGVGVGLLGGMSVALLFFAWQVRQRRLKKRQGKPVICS